jgi:hypothetical protein
MLSSQYKLVLIHGSIFSMSLLTVCCTKSIQQQGVVGSTQTTIKTQNVMKWNGQTETWTT